jgi:hypothetical protein
MWFDDKEDKPKIICNQIRTPDGTLLISHSVHDYIEHKDKITGRVYAVDGGNEYLRRVGYIGDCEELSIMSDAPFEVIRENYYRGTWDKEGNRIWIKMSEMSNGHLKNCIEYNIKLGLDKNCFANQMYKKELEYRGENNK